MKKVVYLSIVCCLLLVLLPVAVSADPDSAPLMAGQTMYVGDVLVWDDGYTLYVKYVITDPDWCITETHLQIATSLELIPQKNGNPIPGHFEKNDEHNCVPEVLYTYDLSEYGWGTGTYLYIAAHAVVQMPCQPGAEETAWADGYDFPGKNWATYFGYTVGGILPD
jgi:hypothetical protein